MNKFVGYVFIEWFSLFVLSQSLIHSFIKEQMQKNEILRKTERIEKSDELLPKLHIFFSAQQFGSHGIKYNWKIIICTVIVVHTTDSWANMRRLSSNIPNLGFSWQNFAKNCKNMLKIGMFW